jgi:F-type H+-transporting ATPase subunit gamma
MPSAREMRLRIRSVKNISQVTRALETVSASKVRKAMAAVTATRPYAEKAWKVIVHIARQPGSASLHPLLTEREEIKKVLVLMVSSDRGLCGAYNVNILRENLLFFRKFEQPVSYVSVGRKGRDLLLRRGKNVVADFSNLPSPLAYMDVSAVGRLVVEDFLKGVVDQVYLAFTDFHTMMKQDIVIRQLLPIKVEVAAPGVKGFNVTHKKSNAVFIYEPDQDEILSNIIPRFTSLQIYQSILSAQASEHAARMIAMRNATDNAQDLIRELQLDYNKARQQAITNEMLDITSGAEALNH